MKHYDAVVVGCGAMGSSVSYNLSSRGEKVLTLERFGLNHQNGSSHGKSRIIRLAYFESELYVPLLRRAFASWGEMEKKSGRKLLRMTGGLMIGKPDGELVQGVLRTARAYGLAHDELTARETMGHFGAFSLEDEYVAVHEKMAGVLFPEECISAFFEQASTAGAEFRFQEPMTRFDSEKEGVRVETEKEVYQADKVVLCAGAWNGKITDGAVPLDCERQVPLWFDTNGDDRFTPERMPVFIMEETRGHYFYGLPDLGHGAKVARTHEGESVNPDRVDRSVRESDKAPVTEFVRRRLPRLDPSPISSTTCIYSNTPDLNFIIDRLPGDPRITVVSACSGHGFKFASVIGEVASDLAVEGRTDYDIGFLRLSRFSRNSPARAPS